MDNFKALVTEFKESFDFERYCSCPEPSVLELEIPGYSRVTLDGLRTAIVCSKNYFASKVADIVIDTGDSNEFCIQIVFRFDLEPKVCSETQICSQAGLQLQCFVPLSYETPNLVLLYKLH